MESQEYIPTQFHGVEDVDGSAGCGAIRRPVRRRVLPRWEGHMTEEHPPTKPTSAADWKRSTADGDLVRLPGSGHVARLVRPSLISLAATSNGVPNPFTADVQRLLASTAPPKDDADRWSNYKRNARAYMEVAALCFREPRLVLDRPPAADE